MRRLCLLAVFLLVAAADAFLVDFSDPAALDLVVRFGRQTYLQDQGCVLLRGGSSAHLKEPTGLGTYQVQFRMIEDEKFQYHVPMVELFKADPENADGDGYALIWQPWGLLTLSATVQGERVYSREFLHPGRDNPNRYESGDRLDLTLRVPPEGDCVEVYCHRATVTGEPTCRFKLLDLPRQGHFGWRNTKWFSHAAIHRLGFTAGE